MGQQILRISGLALVNLLGPGKRSYEIIEGSLPKDTKIVNAMFNFRYTADADEALLKLESAEWPDVKKGEPIPEIVPVMRRIDV